VLRAERVVMTVPSTVAAQLLSRESGAAAEPLRRLVYNPLAIVHLWAQTNLEGLGYQVSLAERTVTRGVTFNDSLFQREGIYTAFLGGAKVPAVVGWSDAELGTVATREFKQVTGYDAAPISVTRVAMPAWDRSWAGLAGLSVPPGIRLATNWESRPGLPGRLAQAKRLAQELARDFGAAALDPIANRV
jgi:oxygen-dependent protoporphyrinogen oxidase